MPVWTPLRWNANDRTANCAGLGHPADAQGVPGVIDVNSLGGYVKQYQVLVEPELLRKYDLSLSEVFAAVANNNANAAGNVLEKHAESTLSAAWG